MQTRQKTHRLFRGLGLKELLTRSQGHRYILVAGTLLFTIAVWLFVELADDAPEGDYLAWENAIMVTMRGGLDAQADSGVATVALAVSALGGTFALVLISSAVVAFFALRRRYRTATLILIATLGGQVLNMVLKQSFARERPDAVIHLVEETSPSFPSGHSMASSVVYLTLGIVLARYLGRPRQQASLIAVAFFLSFAVGVSRVYLGVHYPTDVLAGWTAGTAWALLCCFVAILIEPGKDLRGRDGAC